MCGALRRLDEKAEILMVERGPYVSYANCGLPYHVGGSIEQESSLLVATEQMFREMFAVDCRTRCEVVGISAAQKTVELKNHATGEVTTEKYDKLVLSPGAAPIRPPLPGIDLPGIFSVRTVPDARNIREWLDREDKEDRSGLDKYTAFQTVTKPRRAVVVGGGFIGLEMVENLVHRGLEVTLIEKLNQVMPPLDPEMARLVERYMVKHGVRLELNDGVAGFQQSADGSLEVLTSSGKCHPADIVILAIGVRPETELAKMAGIELGQRGGIRVDEHMRTERPRYLRGRRRGRSQGFRHRPMDAHPVGRASQPAGPDRGRRDRRARLPLSRHPGHLDLSDLRGHDRPDRRQREGLGAARGPGFREDLPLREFARGVLSGCENARDQGPFPEIRRTAARRQVLGEDGVAKRIDSFAMAIQARLTIYDLEESELSYAPPFGSAKDPVNFAGMVAANILRGDMPLTHWDAVDGAFLLDVRNPPELAVESFRARSISRCRNFARGSMNFLATGRSSLFAAPEAVPTTRRGSSCRTGSRPETSPEACCPVRIARGNRNN